MIKHLEVDLTDLFNLQPTLKGRILEQLKKDKRTTITIMQKKLKATEPTTRRIVLELLDEGKIRDLGIHNIDGKSSRVFEIA